MPIGDNFSECLIHKIFSYLSYEDAANSSLYLKHGYKHVEYGKGNNNRKIVDKIMERYKEEKYKFELDITSSPYHHALAFPRIDNWLDISLQNGVKDVVCKVDVPSYPFPISAFLASKSLRELILTGCDIMSLSLSTSTSDHQRMNCHSLRKLSLCDVRLDNNVLQTLVNCCPLIADLEIKKCCLLTKIELWNLQNINIVAFDIIECQNLQSLELSHMSISQGFLEHLISTSQNLESLIILYFVFGELHERFNICRREIDASNLVSFEYVGYEIPERLQTDLSCYSNSTDVNGFHVDALLWSCHPKRLNLLSTVETITCFMDYLKNSTHSTSNGRLPEEFESFLKAFKFISENEHVEVDREDLAMKTPTEIDKKKFY
ncbi:hypothetical protein R3W88_024057 [Solanum pinnatisectum]|uniref:At1g61320/AtMIF1 LRR domain-containing protein n=1 Tax=Solanum pinnatisectum TaxID=50273 RepID=A0AAV9M1E1_9SOLN|nr:hypothetical protein R3W88_024057 [Solanum pinnatisectum]